jgi:hypothetical protein
MRCHPSNVILTSGPARLRNPAFPERARWERPADSRFQKVYTGGIWRRPRCGTGREVFVNVHQVRAHGAVADEQAGRDLLVRTSFRQQCHFGRSSSTWGKQPETFHHGIHVPTSLKTGTMPLTGGFAGATPRRRIPAEPNSAPLNLRRGAANARWRRGRRRHAAIAPLHRSTS